MGAVGPKGKPVPKKVASRFSGGRFAPGQQSRRVYRFFCTVQRVNRTASASGRQMNMTLQILRKNLTAKL